MCLLLVSFVFGQHKLSQPTFARLVEEAKKASDSNQLDRAIPLYRQALAQRPGWKEGWWLLGTALFDQQKYPEAARALTRLVKLDPRNGTGHLILGLAQFELKQDALALKHIQLASDIGIVNDPQLINSMLYHKGVLLLREGQFESALDTLGRLAKRGPGDEVNLALGMAMLRMKPSEAPPAGSTELALVAQIGAAQSLAAQKRFDEARQEYAKLVAANPDFPHIHYAYGHFLLDSRDTEQAVREFEEEIRRNPKDVNARLQIAALRYREDSEAGIRYAKEAVQISPRLPLGRYLLGLLYLDTGRSAEAIPELEIAKKSFSGEPRVYFALAAAYTKVGRKKEAATARATFTRLNAKATESQGEQPASVRGQPMSSDSSAQ